VMLTDETIQEQISRVRMMAEDDGETWDLSDNDKAALKAVLRENDHLKNEIAHLERVLELMRGGE
jgi:hypothetical protein